MDNNKSISPYEIIEEGETMIYKLSSSDDPQSLFTIKAANEWIEQAKKRAVPKMLFGELWFEGEVSILFADTNLGKSILAVQIADSVSRGESISGFKLEAAKQPVLYCDFELSEKQFENRYSKNFEEHYVFDKDLMRIEINPDAEIPDGISFEDHLHNSMEGAIKKTGAKILIIDNITYLKRENEKAKDALPLMKHLKALKNKYGLSILVLAHTPKRDLSKPITQNDLQGSKMLINFCDSAFAIGASFSDKNVRYLKQIKSRNTEIVYDAEHVALFQIEKDHNFLRLGFITFSNESEHLKPESEKDKESLAAKIQALHSQGNSLREIGKMLEVSHMKVKRMLDCENLL